jgi:glycosyltransferase involved in cell wall biosynthesis
VLWNEDNSDLNIVPYVREAYDAGKYAFVTDYIRLWAVYNYGGIYLDSDVELFGSLDDFLDNPAFMGLEHPYSLGTAVIGAEKGNKCIEFLLKTYEKRHFIDFDGKTEPSQNNYILNDVLKTYGIRFDNQLQRFDHITIYPKPVFYPESTNDMTEETRSIHYVTASWISSVSVVMAAYNAEKHIAECLDSILAQTFRRFEIIVVDDGSTDSTKEIVKSYKDNRISLIENSHDYVSSLNIGINRARGKYIARMSADDIMLPDRLQVQHDFMESHPEVDLLGAGFECFGDGDGMFQAQGEVTKESLTTGNRIAHPTVMMRKSSLRRLPCLYERGFDYAEDYRLWLTMADYGLKLYNIPDVVLKYRQSESQIGIRYAHVQWESTKKIKRLYADKLTVIIPFRNEGEEVEKTIVSIKNTACYVEIILIDDASDDNFDYKSVAQAHGCMYTRNDENKGVARSRDIGVSLCSTPYFVLLDGHMRFYDYDWDIRLTKALRENLDSIISSNTVIFTKNDDGSYDNEDGLKEKYFRAFGAYVNMDEPGCEYKAQWTRNTLSEGEIIPVACVLGAVYASSVQHWMKIGGLHGLVSYGSDEPLMSIKTWLSGGRCLLMKNWGVGHLYRKRHPYSVSSVDTVYNSLLLIALFDTDREKSEHFDNYANRYGEVFDKAYSMYEKNQSEIAAHREYLESIFVRSMRYFLDMNDKVKIIKQ